MAGVHRQKRLRCATCEQHGIKRTESRPAAERHREATGHSDFRAVLVVRERKRPSDKAVK